MRFAAAFFLAAASLAGCTPMEWVKPDAAVDQVRGDEQACGRQRSEREEHGGRPCRHRQQAS